MKPSLHIQTSPTKRGKASVSINVIEELFEYDESNDLEPIRTNKEKYSTLLEEYIQYLSDIGDDINPQNKNTGTTLLELIVAGLLDQRLLNYFTVSDINEPESILYKAIQSNNCQTIQWLLNQGFDINKRNKYIGKTILEQLIIYDLDPGVIKFLLGKGAKVKPIIIIKRLFKYVRSGEFKSISTNKEEYSIVVEEYIRGLEKIKDGDINPQYKDTGITLLHLIVKGLLDKSLLQHFSAHNIKKADCF